MNEHVMMTCRLMSYLRARGVDGRYAYTSIRNEDGVGNIHSWPYDIPQPNPEDLPVLTDETAFLEYECLGDTPYTCDIYVINSEGVVRSDRRERFSSLVNNEILLEMGRYQVCTYPELKLFVGNVETRPFLKFPVPTSVRVEAPTTGEVTILIWKV